MTPLNYLAAYPEAVQRQVQQALDAGRLAENLRRRYAGRHDVRTDRALFDYTLALKQRFMRHAGPLARVGYDDRLQVVAHALGTHTTISRVQGSKLKAKREIRVAALFKALPAEFLKMIVVHELAHMKEREHDKAFYQLCSHMEGDYHRLEFDLRLVLTSQSVSGEAVWPELA